MEKTRTALDNELREKSVELIKGLLVNAEEEVFNIKSNVIAVPTLDSAGNESWIEISIKIPKGERLPNGGGYAGYDGYALAQSYKLDLEEKAKKVKLAEEKKAKDIAKKNAKKEEKA